MRKWIVLMACSLCLHAGATGMDNGKFADFHGQYQLADGRTLTMRAIARREVAEIDGMEALEVVAISDTTFVARNGKLKLIFERWPNGNVTTVSIEQMP